MNSTPSLPLVSTEPWFIPLDILMIISVLLAMIVTSCFLLAILLDRTCHTIPMLLAANSYFSTLLFEGVIFSVYIFTFTNDMKQITSADRFCKLRVYLNYATAAIVQYSFLLQAIYRYSIVMYARYTVIQTGKFQLLCICLTWLLGFLCTLVLMFTNEVIYNAPNQTCYLPIGFSVLFLYTQFVLYLFPISIILFAYIKLIRCIKRMSQHSIPNNILVRAQTELRMIRRIIALIVTLFAVGIPYIVFFVLSFFNRLPLYHFRIIFVFVDVSIVVGITVLFLINDHLRESIAKRIWQRLNVIAPAADQRR